MRSWQMAAAMLLVVGLALTAGAAQAGKGKGKKKAQQPPERTDAVVGILAEQPVKAEPAGTWIIKVATGRRGNQQVLPVTADAATEVVIANQPAKIEDLKVGYEVTITPPTGTAKKIEVPPAKK